MTNHFRARELRGRDWQIFDSPASPEPRFRPFFGHYLPAQPSNDDGRKPTALSSFLDSFKPKAPPPIISPIEEEGPEPKWLERVSLVELQTSLPANLNIARESFDQFLTHPGACSKLITPKP